MKEGLRLSDLSKKSSSKCGKTIRKYGQYQVSKIPLSAEDFYNILTVLLSNQSTNKPGEFFDPC